MNITLSLDIYSCNHFSLEVCIPFEIASEYIRVGDIKQK